MLSRFLGSGKGFSAGRGERKKKGNVKTNTDLAALGNTMANSVAQGDAERQLHQFKMPSQQRGMTDFIQSHRSGDRFQYVALTGSDVEDYSSRIRRLVQLSPKVHKSEIPQKDLPQIRLRQDSEKFSLASAVPAKGKEFLMLHRATVIYTPLASFTDIYTTMKISIMDMRKRNNPTRGSVKSNTNIQSKSEFSLDYCIPREDAAEVFLLITRENPTIEVGKMWGVVQAQLEIIECDSPYMENLRETIAVLSLPSSGLDTFHHDPMNLEITMHDNHRTKLQELYSQGDVVDEAEPILEKTKKITYAKSSVPTKPSLKRSPETGMVNMEFSSMTPGNWDFLSGVPKPQVADDQVSYTVDSGEGGVGGLGGTPSVRSLPELDDDQESIISLSPLAKRLLKRREKDASHVEQPGESSTTTNGKEILKLKGSTQVSGEEDEKIDFNLAKIDEEDEGSVKMFKSPPPSYAGGKPRVSFKVSNV